MRDSIRVTVTGAGLVIIEPVGHQFRMETAINIDDEAITYFSTALDRLHSGNMGG